MDEQQMTPWPAALLLKLGNDAMAIVMQVKRAKSRDEVLAIVQPYSLNEADIAIVMSKMGTTETPRQTTAAIRREAKVLNITKSQFYAAAWRAGAAYRQVARLMGVSHQTVYTLASRVLGIEPARSTEPITDEQMAALHRDWLANPQRKAEDLLPAFMKILNTWES